MPVSVPKKSAHTYAPAHFSVGADALIGPADCSVFTKIFGEFVTFQRADEGIGPYKFYRRFPKGGQSRPPLHLESIARCKPEERADAKPRRASFGGATARSAALSAGDGHRPLQSLLQIFKRRAALFAHTRALVFAQTVSTLMRFVLPDVPSGMPPVMTTLSPGVSWSTCFAARSAW